MILIKCPGKFRTPSIFTLSFLYGLKGLMAREKRVAHSKNVCVPSRNCVPSQNFRHVNKTTSEKDYRTTFISKVSQFARNSLLFDTFASKRIFSHAFFFLFFFAKELKNIVIYLSFHLHPSQCPVVGSVEGHCLS